MKIIFYLLADSVAERLREYGLKCNVINDSIKRGYSPEGTLRRFEDGLANKYVQEDVDKIMKYMTIFWGLIAVGVVFMFIAYLYFMKCINY